MKKKIADQRTIIWVLSTTIIILGIGFVILSFELKKIKEKESVFDVSFVSVEKSSSVKGSNIEPTLKKEIIENGQEIEMEFTMNATHDELISIATIENKGTLPAEIVDIIESPDYSKDAYAKSISPITITKTDLKGKIIAAGETMKLKIVAYYNPSKSPVTKRVIPYKIGLITKSR